MPKCNNISVIVFVYLVVGLINTEFYTAMITLWQWLWTAIHHWLVLYFTDDVKEDVLWTDKYHPQHSSDIVGNARAVRRLHR